MSSYLINFDMMVAVGQIEWWTLMPAYLDNTCGKEADEELKDEWYRHMLEPTISIERKAEIQWV